MARLLRFSDYAVFSSKSTLILFIMSVAFFILFTIMSVLFGVDLELLQYIIILIGVDILFLFLSLGIPRILYKKDPAVGSTVTFSFTDENVNIVTVGNGISENCSYGYDKFIKATHNITDVYMYFSKQKALIADVSYLTDEQIEFIFNKINKK